VLSGRGFCDQLITLSEESYRLAYVVLCDGKSSSMRRPCPLLSSSATAKYYEMGPVTELRNN